jgi:hypothetical protein
MDRSERETLRAEAERLLERVELSEVREWAAGIYGPTAVRVEFLFARYEDGDPGLYVAKSRALDAEGNELPMLEEDGTPMKEWEGDYPCIRSDGYYAGHMYDWDDWSYAATFEIREG